MKMNVMGESLSPGVKNGGNTDLPPKVALTEFEQCLRSSFEQEVVDERRVEQSQRV
jgi:hypothetical protein